MNTSRLNGFIWFGFLILMSMPIQANECKELVKSKLVEFEDYAKSYIDQHASTIKKFTADSRTKLNLSNQAIEQITTLENELFNFKSWINIYVKQAKQALNNYTNSKHSYMCKPSNLKGYLEELRTEINSNFRVFASYLNDRKELHELDDDQGLVVLYGEFSSSILSFNLKLDKRNSEALEIQTHSKEKFFRLIKLSEGDYDWVSLKKRTLQGDIEIDIEEEELKFSVEAGKINFVGALSAKIYSQYISTEIIDRTASSIKKIRHYYPNIDYRLKWVNTLSPQDEFVDFYQQQFIK